MKMSFKRIIRIIFLRLVEKSFFLNGNQRAHIAKLGGVNILKAHNTSIGNGVIFDSMYPENIEIGVHTHITMGCILLTHSIDTNKHKKYGIPWKKHKIKIGDYVFIGARTIICSNVEIGDNAIIGAGSIVTKNIPPNQIWAGNPARFIKER